jgi:hypothetical protein
MKKILFPLIAITIGFSIPLVLAEVALRFLPVTTGSPSRPVNEANPVFQYLPDNDYVWSKGWNFNIVNRGRVNNAGFVNDRNYEAGDGTPLLAVIGDSQIEALMVPYEDTLHGRLAAAVEGRGRVYSFAASGAPLSQYLVWARHASDTYRPDAMVFVIISNDFDESLLAYKSSPGFHYYDEDVGGTLSLVRIDHDPPLAVSAIKLSALGRYLFWNLNLGAVETFARIQAALHGDWEVLFPAEGDEERYLGNVPRTVEAGRLAASKRAVDAFFRDLPEMAGLAPQRILFVVDGVRYPNAHDPEAYFVKMRGYLLNRAASLGYGTIDMDDHFLPEHEANGTRFEFPTDAHWNAASHRLAAEAIASTRLFDEFFVRSSGL